MTKGYSGRRLRIPVRWVDGAWECEFGGQVPVKVAAEAELVLSRASISDRTFLEMMEREGLHKVLDEGARLLVGLTVKPESPPKKELKPILKPYECLWKVLGTTLLEPEYRYDPFFVDVHLAGPNDKQVRQFDTSRGGLWLITEGIEAVGLASTTVKLPPEVSDEPVASLNHAYTKLSEAFETWRISHTGNIYKRVLYRELNNKWYPLDVLRNRALQQAEHETAQMLWNSFMAKMTDARSRWTSGRPSPSR